MSDKPLTDAELEAALCRIDNLANNSRTFAIANPEFTDQIKADIHALVAEVRRLWALLVKAQRELEMFDVVELFIAKATEKV